MSCKHHLSKTKKDLYSSTNAVKEGEYLFGIRVDTLDVEQNIIGKDQFLADIFLEYNINYPTIHKITEASGGIFDFRRMRAGNPYYVMHEGDSSKTMKYFIYEKNKVEYVVCHLTDSICVYMGEKEVEVRQKSASGVINSSLYMTLIDNGLPITLALKLADVYAWTIDFYHLQPGDKFKVIYEEQFVEEASIGVKEIKAAYFEHYGKEIYACLYTSPEDTIAKFFDQNGENLQKAFLKMPLKFGRLSSRYNPSRYHPVLKRRKAHLGTDYAAPHGTPILSTGDGVVIERAYKKHNGNYIKIKHNSTFTTQYLHMSKFAKGIRVGTYVSQGQTIGYVGSTGLATGPHVCYRFWKNNKQVDPLREEMPPSDPIPQEHLPIYSIFFDSARVHLDTIEYSIVETTTMDSVSL